MTVASVRGAVPGAKLELAVANAAQNFVSKIFFALPYVKFLAISKREVPVANRSRSSIFLTNSSNSGVAQRSLWFVPTQHARMLLFVHFVSQLPICENVKHKFDAHMQVVGQAAAHLHQLHLQSWG